MSALTPPAQPDTAWMRTIPSGRFAPSSTSTLAKRFDQASSTTAYLGEAAVGANASAPAWRIQKMVFGVDGDVTITWADGNSAFDNVWDNRASLSYS